MIPSVFMIYVFLSIVGGFGFSKDVNHHFEKLSKENVGSEFHQPLTKWEKIEFFIYWVAAFLVGAALHHVKEISEFLTPYHHNATLKFFFNENDHVLYSLHSLLIACFVIAIPFSFLIGSRAAKLLQLKEKKD